jgi:phosphoglucosamine mutase
MKMAKNKWFGTDGVRGIANEFPMTAEFAFKLGEAAAELVCTNQRKVAIAKDTRVSGDMLEAALIAGFCSMGVNVVRLGIVPTPAVTTFVSSLGVDMAVMITASHNPYKDNGIKLIAKDGDKFADETTAELEKLIERNEFTYDSERIGVVSEDFSVRQKYEQIALDMFGIQRLDGLKVVVDCANGCFSAILPHVLQTLGATVFTLGVTPDGYNINRDCGSQHVEAMLAEVQKQQADLGIAVDGDGDRIKICDNQGKLVKSEQLMAFLAAYLEKIGENKGRPFASTKLSNTALERYVTQNLGLKYVSTGVGERLVVKALKENGGVVGGEESGHIVLLDYAKSGDAMMTALQVIKGLRADGRAVSDIFPLFAEDFLYYENFKTASSAKVKQIAGHAELTALVDDLSRKIAGHGRVVIHPSGTEPKIRVWVCGDDKQAVQEYGQQLWCKIEQLDKSLS